MDNDILVDVKIISANAENSLVEYKDKRVVIPTNHIIENKVKPFILERGIAYGINFEEVFELKTTGADVSKVLHSRNIWTKDDVMKRPNEVISALSEALHLTLADLLTKLAERN